MLLWALLVVPPQADTDESAAAVPDHHRDGQRYHSHRKDNCVCGIAVGAEVICVGNKDLIHNVVECRYQQGNHTGYGVLCHQLADPLGFKESIRFLMHGLFPPLNMRKRPARIAGLMPSGRALSNVNFLAHKNNE